MTSIVKRSNLFPALFEWDMFDGLLNEMMSSTFGAQNPVYPTDIVEVKDDNGKVKGYEVDITLAGIPKENVEIVVENDALNISVKKVEKSEDKNRNYLRKGISQRAMQLRYGLHGIDKENIKANMSDGMLKVELPLAEEAKPKVLEIG